MKTHNLVFSVLFALFNFYSVEKRQKGAFWLQKGALKLHKGVFNSFKSLNFGLQKRSTAYTAFTIKESVL